MDTTHNVNCPNCLTLMQNGGANYGGRVTTWTKKCLKCGFKLLVVPINDDYRYTISAKTEAEDIALADLLQEIRDKEAELDDGYSQENASKAIHKAKTYVLRLETGKAALDKSTEKKLTELYSKKEETT